MTHDTDHAERRGCDAAVRSQLYYEAALLVAAHDAARRTWLWRAVLSCVSTFIAGLALGTLIGGML